MTDREPSPIVISRGELMTVPGVTIADDRDGTWFAKVWQQHCRPGMHLRAIFYKLLSVGTVTMPPGVRPHVGRGRPAADPVLDAICQPFENTKFCWLYLQKAALAARRWRLVDARDFEEHRSPSPHVNAPPPLRLWPKRPDIYVPRAWPYDGSFPKPEIDGYDYDPGDQPLMIELWCEKTTMDEALIPLCRYLNVNFQPLTGMFSVTRAVELLCRAKKPTVVLYISDLDAAGCNMPTAFKDALDHYAPIYAPGIDIRLKQIALTEQQVLDYRLPRNAIDPEGESPYNKRFRVEHPLGPCELDALEAIHPGALAWLVRAEVDSYRDQTLHPRLVEAEAEASKRVAAAWEAQTAEARQQLSAIEADTQKVRRRLDAEIAPLERQIREIRKRFDAEIAPLEAKRDVVRSGILDQTIDVELPPRPVPELPSMEAAQ